MPVALLSPFSPFFKCFLLLPGCLMGLNWTPCCFWLWWTTWRHPGRSCKNYVDDTNRVIWEGPKLPVVSIMAQKISLVCLLLFLLDAYLAVFLLSFKTFSVFFFNFDHYPLFTASAATNNLPSNQENGNGNCKRWHQSSVFASVSFGCLSCCFPSFI